MTDNILSSCSVKLRVPFHHVDPLLVVWHGHYFEYFEAARDALFDSIHISLEDFYAEHGLIFPVIRGSVKFIHPLRYKDIFISSAKVTEAKRKIVVDYEITLEATGTRCTVGRTEQAVLKMPEAEIQYEVPVKIREALGLRS